MDGRDRDAGSRSVMASILGWLALLISVVALILAWVAFNNTSDENLEAMIQQGVQDAIQLERPLQQDTMNDNTLNETPNTMDDSAPTPGTSETPNGTMDSQDGAVMPENN